MLDYGGGLEKKRMSILEIIDNIDASWEKGQQLPSKNKTTQDFMKKSVQEEP